MDSACRSVSAERPIAQLTAAGVANQSARRRDVVKEAHASRAAAAHARALFERLGVAEANTEIAAVTMTELVGQHKTSGHFFDFFLIFF